MNQFFYNIVTTKYRKVVRIKQVLFVIDYKILSMRCTEKQRFLSAVHKHATMVRSERESYIWNCQWKFAFFVQTKTKRRKPAFAWAVAHVILWTHGRVYVEKYTMMMR